MQFITKNCPQESNVEAPQTEEDMALCGENEKDTQMNGTLKTSL
jgi:hypothetical protein